MKKSLALILSLVLAVTAFTALAPAYAQSPVTITIATVNNGYMVVMQGFSAKFEAAYPNIKLKWVVLPENELRTRVTTDVASGTGSFDVVTVGAYEVPTWAKNGWLVSVDGLMTANPKSVQPNYDKADLLKSVSNGISYNGELYAVPFYAESSMTFYNKAMFKAAGLTMPDEPTWDQIRDFACKLNLPDKKQYGIALRGLPGWGEVMAPLTTVVNTFGGKWFDQNWNAQLNSKEWHDAVSFYVNLLHDCGIPGAANNGYTESITALAPAPAALPVAARASAGALSAPKPSKISNAIGFPMAPSDPAPKGYHWLWSWHL